MSLFHKNGVITGQVSSYCLPCDVHLGTESEVRAHIADSRHRRRLDSTSYVDIYKDDGIRKMPQGYYCEHCNQLFVTSYNVKMHVSGRAHLTNKDTTWLRHQGDVVVVLNKLVIDGDSWHGLVDGACALCNSEYLDKEAHKTIPTHLLKLTQSSVELHTSGAIYRKGDDFFHCLVCNAVFSVNYFKTHFEQADHVKFYNKCCESYKNETSNGHINEFDTFNGDIQKSSMNTTNLNDNLGLKLTETKSIVPKPEKNITIENHQQSLRLQEKTADLILCEAEEERTPKKDREYAQVVGGKTDVVNENLLNMIASEISQILNTTVNFEDALQKSLPISDSEMEVVNEKYILKPTWLTNKAQVYDNKKQTYYGDQSEVTVPKDPQTQTTQLTSETVYSDSLQNNESEIDTVNEKEISGHYFTNNAKVVETKVNIYGREHTEIIASDDSQTQVTTETVYSESPQNNPSKIDTLIEKEIVELQFTNSTQVGEIKANIHKEIIASDDSQAQVTTDTVYSKSPQNNASKIDTVTKKEIVELQLANSTKVGEIEANIHKDIIDSEDSETQLTIETVYSESPQKNASEIATMIEKEIIELQLENNKQVDEIEANIHKEIIGLDNSEIQLTTDTVYSESPQKQGDKVKENWSEVTAPDNSQPTHEVLNKAAPKSFRNTESEINMVNEKQKTRNRQEFDNNKPIPKIQQLKQKITLKKEKVLQIAKANKIRYKEGYTKAYCSICNTEIPSSLKNIYVHVNNATHMHKAEKIHKYTSNVILQRDFVKQIAFEQIEPMAVDVIINNTYCIDLCSYSLLTRHQSHIRCHVCDVNFNGPLFKDHQQSETHKNALESTSVVCSVPSEFVREVQPGFYHCGFCNRFEGNWQGITNHFKLRSHVQQKLRATEKLQYILTQTKD